MPDTSASGIAAPSSSWDAADYSRHSAQQQKWARELIVKLDLRAHESVLDIGCGDGKVTAEIAAAVPGGHVVGIDLSDEMIRFARTQFTGPAYPHLRFEPMDAGALNFTAEFEVVFSNAVLHWVADHRPVLAGIARALKPGGRMLLQMGGAGNAATIIEAINELIDQPQWRTYFEGFPSPYHFYGPAEYRAWLTAAGLMPMRVELIPKDMVQAWPEGLAGWLRSTWWPYPQQVPEPRRAEFMAAMLEACVKRHPPDAQGNVHLPMVRLEVEAARTR
jgi:trans-aconitate 2-methyltransferase